MIFDKAYVFVTGARGRDKQSFAVAREFASNVIAVENYSERIETEISSGGGLIVSCGAGEQTGAAILAKKAAKDKAFAIQLMDPEEGHANFDLIVSPIFEDRSGYRICRNVLEVLCMPSRNEYDVSGEHHIQWKNWAAKRDGDLSLVLVGGSSQFVRIKENDFRETCEIICQRMKDSGSDRKLIFVTSPRTDSGFISIIKEVTNRDRIQTLISDWNKHQGRDDIVHGLLRHVTDVIVTGDSMSMVSEAVYYGNSVTIANNGGFGLDRYAKLHAEFVSRNLAQPLTATWKINTMHGDIPNPLAEIKANIERIMHPAKDGQFTPLP